MRRMGRKTRASLTLAALAGIAPGAAAPRCARADERVGPSMAVVLQLPDAAESPRERLVVALALEDTAAVERILEDKKIPAALAHWHRARIAQERKKWGRGRAEWKAAARAWKRTPSSLRELLPAFERDYVEGMARCGDLAAARRALRHPRASHREDARWQALDGWLRLEEGDVSNALLRLEGAWQRAGRLERKDPVFARRALAQLAAGDTFSAAESWLDYVEGLRRGGERQWAARFWEENPGLERAIRRAGRRTRAARWLAGLARREEAFELAAEAWRQDSGTEAQEGYLLAAEQLYRLRRHAELSRWLQQTPAAEWDAQARARLAAYPWGVRRRAGASEEIARGFERVAGEFAGTDRAVEAEWEAAWMWELSGHPRRAEEHFLHYAREHPKAPFARAAALRAIYLPLLQGNRQQVLKRARVLEPALGDGPEEAAAQWLAARSAQALGRKEEAEDWWRRLRRRHPDSPYLVPPPARPSASKAVFASATNNVITCLYENQLEAFEKLAEALAIPDLFAPRRKPWRTARALLGWGFFPEGEFLLQRAAADRGHDAASALRATALAWQAGRPARQAREAWWLTKRLAKRREDLGEWLDQVAWPTPYAGALLPEAARWHLPPGLLWSVMRRESFYEAEVVSRAGAWGLLQVLPTTARRMAHRLDEDPGSAGLRLLDPRENLHYGCAYLAGLLQEFGGDPYQALAAYNAGESNARRWRSRMAPGDPSRN